MNDLSYVYDKVTKGFSAPDDWGEVPFHKFAKYKRMVEDGNAANEAAAIEMIKNDITDDGGLTFNDINTGTGNLLQAAVENFIASPENNTGITLEESTLDEAINNAVANYVLVN